MNTKATSDASFRTFLLATMSTPKEDVVYEMPDGAKRRVGVGRVYMGGKLKPSLPVDGYDSSWNYVSVATWITATRHDYV